MQASELPSCLFMPQHVCLKIYSPIYTLVGTAFRGQKPFVVRGLPAPCVLLRGRASPLCSLPPRRVMRAHFPPVFVGGGRAGKTQTGRMRSHRASVLSLGLVSQQAHTIHFHFCTVASCYNPPARSKGGAWVPAQRL